MKYKHTQPVILHADMMDDFKKAINGQDVSEFFREIQEDVVEKYRQEKKEVAPEPKGAINYIYNKPNKGSPSDKKQSTLDIFKSKTEINSFLEEIAEPKDLMKLRDNSKMVYSIAITRLKKL